ncbi:hypothetical protein GCM10009549_35230 [Streptomyces thermoalcalitolerans]|uniref:Uncharacterized protein n=1 Tax=Streptomyces thermoalcalitolerans TaxID=65605 RepID=A0ABN1NX48_9ACTN
MPLGPGPSPSAQEPGQDRPPRPSSPAASVSTSVPAPAPARRLVRGRVPLVAGALAVLLAGTLTAGLLALRGEDTPSADGGAGNRAAARPSPSVPALAEPVSALGPAAPRGVWSLS